MLSLGAARDPELLELAACSAPHQPPANLLYAAVHALLLAGDAHPLRRWYPDVLDEPFSALPADAEAFAAFRDFVLSRREAIEPLLRTRRVQTNVVRRTTCLLPLFAEVARRGGERPLALLELGCSAGLNLHWDRYGHRYDENGSTLLRWGDADAALVLSTELRGARPELTEGLSVAWRAGIDLHPVDANDPESLLWLRALIFPEHLERHREIEAAVAIARAHPARIERGDAVERAPALLAEMPEDATPCFYASAVFNQIPREARAALWSGLEAASQRRPLWLVSMDGRREGSCALRLFEFRDGGQRREHAGEAHSHGRWLALA